MRPLSRGFSLVELLIVIAVIGILAGLVTSGYIVYIKNAKQSQIASTLSAYQSALKGVQFEDNQLSSFVGACIGGGSSSPCCAPTSASQWFCGHNDDDPQATDIYNSTQRYLQKKRPQLPNFDMSYLGSCPSSGAVTKTDGPCDAANVTYVLPIPLADGEVIAGLVYYLPKDFDCQSSNTLAFNSSDFTWSKQPGTKFSRRVSTGSKPFTECVVSLG